MNCRQSCSRTLTTQRWPRYVKASMPPHQQFSPSRAADATLLLLQLHAELVEALAAAEASLQDLQAAAAPAGMAGHLKPRTLPTSMHPENIYCQQEPDFLQLAEAHPPLQQYVTRLPSGRGALDFTSWEATRELTAALLQADHGITWSLPQGHLIPPVPNRLNYLHWIHSLLQLSCSPGGR